MPDARQRSDVPWLVKLPSMSNKSVHASWQSAKNPRIFFGAYAQSKMGESCCILETGGAGGTLRRKDFLEKPFPSLPKGDWT